MSVARGGRRFLEPAGIAWIALVALASSGCSSKPTLSDTGFVGTWGRRGFIGDYRSTISIVRQGERHLFRWKFDSDDRTWSVRCNWDGVCEERLEGKHVAQYVFEVTQKPGDDFLTVACTRNPTREGEAGFRYVDDLVLEPGGLELTSYTREQNDKTYPRESTQIKRFDKISNGVSDPPPRAGS